MDNYEKIKMEESLYLKRTLDFIQAELGKDLYNLKDRRTSLIASRKEMWEKGPKSADDFDSIPEMNHYLDEITYQTQNYERVTQRIEKYTSMLDVPYFGRFDFKEDGYHDREKIYIGLHSLMDMKDMSILIYDWRSPIASMYYQCEVGRGSYTSPVGTLSGELSIKRQYSIEKGKLQYFFDSSIQIKDEILQQVLSKNTTPKMRHIVETIQKEQDLIIRDTQSGLLIVQGVAGSGKTSIALHRIAFLLYSGMDAKLFSNNIMIVSPNAVFSDYISRVLPSLGEENVEQTTLDEITSDSLGNHFIIEERSQMLESLVLLHKHHDLRSRIEQLAFKGSLVFKEIIDRFLDYYQRRLIPFEDIYYDGQIIKTKQQLKSQLLKDQTGLPLSKKLNRISTILIHKIEGLKENRLKKIQHIVEQNGNHAFNIEARSDFLANQEILKCKKQIQGFARIDYFALYTLLFQNSQLLLSLAKGLELPYNIDYIIKETQKELLAGYISYEDCAGLLYLKLKLEGSNNFSTIKHLVIDEAQDYYPLQYEILKLMFGHANFTVLGDFNQTLEKHGSVALYADIASILNKEKSIKLSLNKGYRSSYEISMFSQKIIGNYNADFLSFARHGTDPSVVQGENLEALHKLMAQDIKQYAHDGYESIAVICKTQQESHKLQKDLENHLDLKLKPLIIPSYMAKGLEFDVVLVYNVCHDHYSSELDKKLLYIACTRALHELSLYYVGTKSSYLDFNM